MARLRIGMLFDGAAERYGLLTAARNLLMALPRNTLHVTGIFLTDGPAAQALMPACDEAVPLRMPPMPRTRAARGAARSISGTARLAAHVARAVRDIRPLVRQRDIQLLHSHYWHTFLVSGAAARLCGCKSAWHLHGGYAYRGAADLFWSLAADSLVDRIFCISHWVHGTLPASLRGRASVLYNGVETDSLSAGALRGQFRERFGVPKNARLVGTFGGVIDRKGFGYFVESALAVLRQRDDVWFALVGDAVPDNARSAELMGGLRRAVGESAHASRFIFTGHLPEAWRYMCDFDIITLPTVPLPGDPTPDFGEGFGLVTAEAMTAGAAVIGTACGATAELIEHGRGGLIIPPRDSAALTDALMHLLNNRELSCAMGAAGAERVRARFDLSRVAQSAEELYDMMCCARSG